MVESIVIRDALSFLRVVCWSERIVRWKRVGGVDEGIPVHSLRMWRLGEKRAPKTGWWLERLLLPGLAGVSELTG